MNNNPAENLVGQVLSNGWVVTEKIGKGLHATGGNFSVCYYVEKEGKKAFLKALNLSRAFASPNFLLVLEKLVTAHNYECDLLKTCSDKRMSKVVLILDDGEVPASPENGIFIPVNYLIFETADKTARDHIVLSQRIDNAWIMRSLHNVAVGLNQLHKNGIAHQDLKPSNVLMFEKSMVSKIADLGRAERKTSQSIYVDLEIAGDPSYAPPELLYHYVNPDWSVRRQSCDLYHLGSLLTFYYTKSQMTSLLKSYLPTEYHWQNWSGDFGIVLPYLEEAFEVILLDLTTTIISLIKDEKTTHEIISLLRQLCAPNPLNRGHPSNFNNGITKYSLERYISWFVKLAMFFETKLL